MSSPMDSDTLNYRGLLFAYGANSAPFLASIAPRAKRTASWTIPINTVTPSSPTTTVSEDTAKSDAAATTVSISQGHNTCQIDWYHVESTFKKESLSGQFSGINADLPGASLSDIDLQKRMGLITLAKKFEESMLQGTEVVESSSATLCHMGGFKTVISTNTVAGGSKALTKAMIEELAREMAASGTPGVDLAILGNSFQIQKLSDIYGVAPMDRTMGGVAIDRFLVPGLGVIRAIYSPQMPTDEVYIVEMSVCAPVFCPVPVSTAGINIGDRMDAGGGPGMDVAYYNKPQAGAVVGGFLYMQTSFDYGPEMYHGSITGLATS